MLSGAVGTVFGFYVTLRYAVKGDTVTPLFGTTPMAFTTAGICVIYGIAIFWDGWLTRERTIDRPPSRAWTTHQVLQLTLAIISALSMIAVALIGVLK